MLQTIDLPIKFGKHLQAGFLPATNSRLVLIRILCFKMLNLWIFISFKLLVDIYRLFNKFFVLRDDCRLFL